MTERELAALMVQAGVRGGVVCVPAGEYRVFQLNCWTLRFQRRRDKAQRQPAVWGRRSAVAIAHRMKSFARLTGPLLIPVGVVITGESSRETWVRGGGV